MEYQFRKAAIGGFNRQDVVDYVERTASAHGAQMAEMKGKLAELEALTEELEALKESYAAKEKELSGAQQTVESLQAQLKGSEGEVATLQKANQEGQEKIFALTPDAEAYRAIKERTAGMELDAHVRAQKTIDDAQSQAKTLREEGRQWLTQMKTQYTTARGELDIATLRAVEELKTTQKNLETLTQTMSQRDRVLEQMVAQWSKKLDKK